MRSETLISVYLDSLKLAVAAKRVCVQLNANFGLEQRQFSTDEEQFCPPLPPEAELDTLHVTTNQFKVFRHIPSGDLFVSMTLTDPDALSAPTLIADNRKPLPVVAHSIHALMFIEFPSVERKTQSAISETVIKHAELLSGLLLQIEVDNGLTTDSVTGLPNRLKFQSQVASAFQSIETLGILLIHVTEFTSLNKALGKDEADRFLVNMASSLEATLRNTDVVSRFGGALFAVCAPVRNDQEAMRLARKLQVNLQNTAFFEVKHSLNFCIGGVVTHFRDDASSSAMTLEFISSTILKAEQALAVSQQQPLASINIWNEQQRQDYEVRAEQAVGLLTTNSATDFRNMQLVWDIANIIAAENELGQLMAAICRRLGQSFNIDAAGIGVMTSAGLTTHLSYNLVEDINVTLPLHATQTDEDEQHKALAEKSTSLISHERVNSEYFVVPLETSSETVMFMHSLNLSELTLPHNMSLLNAVTQQISKAYLRIRAEQSMLSRLEAENIQLQSTLSTMKKQSEHSHFVFSSEPMIALFEQASKAFDSPYPMLISGEQGSGKRALLKTIYQTSELPDSQLITLECATLSDERLKSELDALTTDHAIRNEVSGQHRLIVVLNDIEALPLQAQGMLLSWIEGVGAIPQSEQPSSGPISLINIKLIALTGYELKVRARQGSFNSYLYGRLSVQRIQVPPLRERAEDIPLLCNHFLRKFKRQFSLSSPQITPRALERMMDYPWPGNIKQLEATLLEACSSGNRSYIEWEDLNITDVLSRAPNPFDAYTQPMSVRPALRGKRNSPPVLTEKNKEKALADLVSKMEVALAQYVAGKKRSYESVGKWLTEQLVFQTHIHAQKDFHLGSVRLGISSSTLRRKVQQAPLVFTQVDTLIWQDVLDAMHVLSSGAHLPEQGTIAWLQKALLTLLLKIKPNQLNKVALLMGMSEPTMYKLRKELRQGTFTLPA